MLSFLKVFARGIICTLLLPFIVLVWVLYAVYCLFAFFAMAIRAVVMFFAGENPTGDLKEDIEAKRILLEREQAQEDQAKVMSMMYQNMAAQQMYNQSANPPTEKILPEENNQPTQVVPEEPKDDFNPFTPSEEKEPEPFGFPKIDDSMNEGGNDNGQSY